MWIKLFSVARNCFTETVRQPIYGVILFVTAGVFVLNVALSMFTLDTDNKILKDIGLSTMLMSGLFLAAFSAAGVITREIDNKTVLTVISKPVGRPAFILGKFLGLTAALTLATYLNSLIFLLTVRHKVLERSSQNFDMPVILFGGGAVFLALAIAGFCNYLYGTQFPSAAIGLATPLLTIAVLLVCFINPEWSIQPFAQDFIEDQVVAAIILVFLAVLVLTAVAIAASTRLGQVMTLAVCTGVLLIGLVSDYFFGRKADDNLAARLAYWVAPNIGFLWVTDAITQGNFITMGYVGLASVYALCYAAAAMCLGIALFQKREVG